MTTALPEDSRYHALRDWLRRLPGDLNLDLNSLAPVSGDASFRRYFRIHTLSRPMIVMDAPPPQEDCTPFVEVARRLARGGLHVPEIFAQDLAHGFLLLEDLGSHTFLEALQQGALEADLQRHYRGALQALVRLQQCEAADLPTYDGDRLLQELALFPQWYLGTHLGFSPDEDSQATLHAVFTQLARQAMREPQVLVHRDYHSPNLMVGAGAPDYTPGIIDFQDAVRGPISYDLASLVMDARTDWEESQQLDWAIRYWEYAREAGLPVPHDFADFHQQYEWMGLQRNLRILGVFARLSHRDGKHHYQAHIPRVGAYVRQVAGRYRPLRPLLRILDAAEHTPRTTGYSF